MKRDKHNLTLMPLIGATLLALTACETVAVATPAPDAAGLKSANGYEGRVRLTRFLDEPDGYCLDVPGPVGSEMLEFPLVAHTCHADPLGDQVFQINANGSGEIRWTTDKHDLCFTATKSEAMSKLKLEACEAPERQRFEYTERREFNLSGTDLCIHVERTGAGQMQPPGEGQDAYGRGRSVNAQFTHLMRFLELRPCGDGDPSMSRWKAIE